MRFKFFALLVMGVALAACGGAADTKSTYMKKAQALFDEGNFDEARLEFRNALQIDPKDVPARFMLAKTLEKLQDWRGAAGSYLAVIEADPKHREALARMGQLYLLGNNPAEAHKLADKLLALNPQDADGLVISGAIKALDKNLEGALKDTQLALQTEPGNVNAAALLASIKLQQGQPEAAIRALQTAATQNPDSIAVQALLARVYAPLGRNDEAEQALRKIAAKEPKVLGHRLRVAQLLAQQKKTDATEAVLKLAVEEISGEDKDATQARLSLIEFQARARDPKTALAALEKMVAAEPDNDELRVGLAKLHEASAQPAAAIKAYDEIIARQKDPKNPVALAAKTRKAMVLASTGERAASKALVDEVLKDNPNATDALILRGSILVADGNANAAILDYRTALKDAPQNTEIARLLARAHGANNEPQLALDVLKEAVKNHPNEISLKTELAKLHAQQNDLDAAVQQLDEILKIEPANRAALESKFKVFVAQKNWPRALAVADVLKAVRPKDPLGFYYAGLVFQGQKKLPESIEQFESALALDPNSGGPLSQLIKSQLALGKPTIAEKRLREALEQNPKNFAAANLAGELALSTKRYAEAQQYFETAIKLNEKWAVPYRNLAVAQRAQDQDAAAVATLEQGLEKNQGSPLLVTALAGYYETTGQFDKAIAQYEKMLKDQPDSLLAVNNLAMFLAEYSTDEASQKRALALTVALQKVPEPAYLDTIGWVEYKNHNFQRAVDFLEQASKGAPKAALIHYHLGMAYLGLGKPVLAKKNLKEALEGEGNFRGKKEAQDALAKL
ncbi:MAG: tetratricopeptide repeat protein [Gammaproteobacteria bacterium]|nr:tetratricopeptide repeat protein [Gammaproteobacteria bacterium]